MKKVFATVIILCSFFILSAKVTAYYFLDATGLTSEFALAKKCEIPESAEYENYEALETDAKSYKQKLNNLRLFKSVDMEISDSGDGNYEVNYKVVSAFSFLAVPYPRYDSNDGFSFQIIAKDSNLFGTLGRMTMAIDMDQQTEGDDSKLFNFESSAFDVSMTLVDMMIGNAEIQTTVTADIDLSEDEWAKESEITADVSVANITFGETKFSPVLKYTGNLGELKGSTFGFDAGFSNIPVGNTRVSVDPFFYTQVTEDDDKLWFDRTGLSAGVSYNKFSFSAGFTDYFLEDSDRGTDLTDPCFTANMAASYSLFSWMTPSVSLYFDKVTDDDFLNSIAMSEALSFSYKGVSYSVGETTDVDFITEKTSIAFSASASTSGGEIDYVDGDFRKGFKYSVAANALFTFTEKFSDRTNDDNYIRAHGELTWFPWVTKYFDPSIRLVVTAAERHLGLFTPSDLGEGYGFIYTDTSSVEYLGQFMRGIRNTDSKSLGVSDCNIAAVMNLDLKLKADSTVDFMHLYLTPFIDSALLVDFEGKKAKWFASFGFDGTAVLTAYPSFPVRISFGCDYEKIKRMIETKVPETGFFEIFVGLHHFY